jgi:NADH-quinone oxidoreductase subunit L
LVRLPENIEEKYMLSGDASGYFFLAPWVVFLPLIGLLINLIFGRRLGETAVGVIASLATGLAFIVAVLLALALTGHTAPVTYHLADWINVDQLNVPWNFWIDSLSTTMMLVVSGVGTLIHIYAIGYMHRDVRYNGDPGRFRRFFVYLNLFILAMMILVSADSYLMTFVGWEGVGLCSYLLIGFWYEKGAGGIGNAKAAKKAFIVNRIGDFGFLIAMFLIFWGFGSLQFKDVFAKAPQIAQSNPGLVVAITLFLLLGVTGKSAQLPLFVWLPDAMAGPTPVSALIHAATMVTAGVYLVTRSYALYSLVPTAQAIVAWVGALTALFAATIAVAQMDIKRVLAYSTISQLGFMVAAVGMGAYTAGMFHLITHAFFKALLFLSAGSVIQGLEEAEHAKVHGNGHRPGRKLEALPLETEPTGHALDAQDMRNMGGLRSRMKVTFWVYLIGALAISGVFPLSGFFSKDEILAEASRLQPGVLVVLIVAAFLTAFYMGRQVVMVFFGKPRSEPAARATENPVVITVPLVILAVLAALGGALNLPGVNTLEGWLALTITGLEPGAFIFWLALLALALSIAGLWLAWAIYHRAALKVSDADPLSRYLGPIYTGMQNKWWVDAFYTAVFVEGYRRLADFIANPIDLGFIDALGAGLGSATRSISSGLRRVQSGFVRSYALVMLLGVVVFFGYLIFTR